MSIAEDGYDSPEQAALASWLGSSSANARVRLMTISGRRAEVVIVTDQSDPDYVDYV